MAAETADAFTDIELIELAVDIVTSQVDDIEDLTIREMLGDSFNVEDLPDDEYDKLKERVRGHVKNTVDALKEAMKDSVDFLKKVMV